MEVPRINGRVIREIKFGFPCPVTNGMCENSRVRGSITHASCAERGRVETEEQASIRGASRSGDQGLVFIALKHHLGCNITQEALCFPSLLLRYHAHTIKFILLMCLVDGMVFLSSWVFFSPIPLVLLNLLFCETCVF